MSEKTFERTIANKTFTISTGKLAQQSNGSVVISQDENMLLVTSTSSVARDGAGFFPLTVEVEERMYARGKIPGSFFKREGRPSTDSILICRLTDRTLRPLFPKGYRNEVQVVAMPLSLDLENPFDILSILGSSISLGISDIPFEGPVSACRIGYINEEFVINPTFEELENSTLDLLVCGTESGVTMIEADGQEIEESIMEEAIKIAQNINSEFIEFQKEIIKNIGKEKAEFQSFAPPEELVQSIKEIIGNELNEAMSNSKSKSETSQKTTEIKEKVSSELSEKFSENQIDEAFELEIESIFRSKILIDNLRRDDRKLTQLRKIDCDVSLLPRTHGSSLFTRGETQILGVTTLGPLTDAQKLDNMSPIDKKEFMLHYNFPPYSVGETGRLGFTGRREIGHGALAEKALAPVLPDQTDFPYTIRIVADTMSSNGSTSMASTCAGSLSLMDAGVPIKSHVAGISIGLVSGENDEFTTLTDIQGLEDHFGDMDFKVAGTENGITAIQLDIKVQHISLEIVKEALDQAKIARLEILKKMEQAIDQPREELNKYAPKMTKINIPVDKIGLVIGPGGKTIKDIVEKTEATLDVQDDGTIFVASSNSESTNMAIEMVENLTKEVEVGEIYTGKVVKITDFGAFVQILPGKDGLVHISELSQERVEYVEDVVELDQEITVEVIRTENGKISLSRKRLLTDDEVEADEIQLKENRDSDRRSNSKNGGRGRDSGGRGRDSGGRGNFRGGGRGRDSGGRGNFRGGGRGR